MIARHRAGVLLCLCCTGLVHASTVELTPVSKVMTLLTELTTKITAAGEAELKAYEEFAKWCDETSANVGFQIKDAVAEKAELEAAIAKSQSDAEASQAHVGDLAGEITATEADLTNATSIRKAENGEFIEIESELMEAIDTLGRAITILEREMKKNPAFLQHASKAKGYQGLVQTMTAFINSAMLSDHDKKKLMSLVQDHQKSDDADAESDDDLGAPAAATYKSHSQSILDTLEDLREKAEGELAELRKGESASAHNFAMLKQSLTDQTAALNKEMSDTKTSLSSSQEALAQAKGDLEVTVKDLAAAESSKATVDTDCKTAAEDHETSMKGRADELEALAKAKEIIANTTSGAVAQTYSFMQLSRSSSNMRHQLSTRSDLAEIEIAAMVKKLAEQQHSTELAQLASRITTVMRYEASTGDDPFAKVKGLISDMIERLESQASAEASHKAYCDEETAKTAAKKVELTNDVDTLSAKIDKAAAESAKLKGHVADLQKQLADLAKLQAEMDKARADEHTAFVTAKADLEQGLEGIQQAIRVLRDYYAGDEESFLQQEPAAEVPEYHSKASGSGNSIIEILEVISSDFSKNLAQETVAEDEAQTQYEKTTQENKILTATKEQDVKYKTQEAQGLDKAVTEHSSDRDGLQAELSAVLDYSEKLTAQCVAKPETYEERKRRREAEIQGLKDALKYLEGEAMFLQKPAALASKRFMSIAKHV